GDEGFSMKVKAATQGDERSRLPALWVMEADLKPVRLIWVDTPNPQTGEIEKKMYLYLCYRAINRPIAAPSARETEPVNNQDKEPIPAYFIPEAVLIPQDANAKIVIPDTIQPVVQEAINAKERRDFKNSVTVVQTLPTATDEAANDANSVHGVFIFAGVDPAIDRFTVYLSGFSNAYQAVPGPDGKPVLERKTIKQEFWRPGDQFDPANQEFRFQGAPEWVYRPDPS
ncbi:MAG: hypothetical protein KDA78_11965, partial [Planctomycetaceae bacterium]|nr:hypothetical protein [Planctomycetaceae bacterium]